MLKDYKSVADSADTTSNFDEGKVYEVPVDKSTASTDILCPSTSFTSK